MNDIIVALFLVFGAIIVIGGGIILWLNARDSTMQDQSYTKDFSAGKLVSKYKFLGESDEDKTDPYEELRFYSQGGRPPAKGTRPGPPAPTPSESPQREAEAEAEAPDANGGSNDRDDKPENGSE